MKENSNIQLNTFDDPNFSRLIDLTKTTYANREICESGYLGWEYVLNPGGEALIQIAEDEKKVASQYVLLPHDYVLNGRRYRGSISVNTLTDPDYRGKGLFSKLAEKTFGRCTNENIRFTIGIPNHSSYPIFKSKLGFETLGTLPLLIRPLKPIKMAFNYLKRKKTKGDIEIPFFRGTITAEDYKISKLDPIADENIHADFFRKFHSVVPFATARSMEYIRWRYIDIPIRKYIVLKLCKHNQMLGYAVFRARYINGLRCGILVDLCVAEKDMDGWDILMDVIYYISRNNKMDLIFSTAPEHSFEYKLLRKSGYKNVPTALMPRKLPLIFRAHDEHMPAGIRDFSKWFFTFGDYDVF